MPQTKFVTGKALGLGLRPIVVINKVDRGDARPHEVHDECFDLFAALDADDDQLDFPTLFASGRQGWAVTSLDDERKDLVPLFDLIVKHVHPPEGDVSAPFALLVKADSPIKKISDIAGKKLGDEISIRRFVRFQVGETAAE